MSISFSSRSLHILWRAVAGWWLEIRVVKLFLGHFAALLLRLLLLSGIVGVLILILWRAVARWWLEIWVVKLLLRHFAALLLWLLLLSGIVGIFSWCVGVLRWSVGIFSRRVGVFSWSVGIFSRSVGVFSWSVGVFSCLFVPSRSVGVLVRILWSAVAIWNLALGVVKALSGHCAALIGELRFILAVILAVSFTTIIGSW